VNIFTSDRYAESVLAARLALAKSAASSSGAGSGACSATTSAVSMLCPCAETALSALANNVHILYFMHTLSVNNSGI
jgi:hypothetical protein